jgi:hypothetical protein
MAATNTNATIEELLEAVFSVRSVQKLYNEGQLPLERCLGMRVRIVEVSCEIAASLAVSQLEQ